MKFLTTIVLIGLLSFILSLYLPWWSIAIAAFGIELVLNLRPAKAFLAAFCGLFLLWGSLSWWIDTENHSILSKKIAILLPLGGSVFLLILMTALIGGLVAGLAALSASFLRKR